MAMRGVALLPSMIAKSLICVDKIVGHDMLGAVYNPYINGPVEFGSWYEMTRILESFFDSVNFPHPHYRYRLFGPKRDYAGENIKESEVRQYMSEELFANESGKKATFVVHVKFRQNATWQGSITWTEGKETQNFRSVMEMLRLMESALDLSEADTPMFGGDSLL